EEKSVRNNGVVDKNIVETNKSNAAETLEEVDRDDKAANRTNKERLGVPRKTSWEKK
ncbi:hypothetical protein Tco_0029090, partial [Tanacetum coccineum]